MIYPSQICTISPYSEYNSNIINQLTRLVTRGVNCIDSLHAIDVVMDSTSSCTVSSGQCYKDDVIIQITEDFTIDMNDSSFFLPNSVPFNEVGYYYVMLAYTYAKSKPAPKASITVIKPSQQSTYIAGNYLFLKVLNVIFDEEANLFEITEVLDSDPTNSSVKRVYSQTYAGAEDTLPTFTQSRDESRIIYVKDKDEIYFGTSSGWESSGAVRGNIDTTECLAGQLVYVGLDGLAHPAIATNPLSFADGVCNQVGTLESGEGKVRLYGECYNVPIETGITVVVGNKLFLSKVQAGTVTNYISEPYSQSVGTCTAVNETECTLWFMPGSFSGTNENPDITPNDMYQDLLLNSIFSKLSIDPIINLDYIDPSTTATINVIDYQVDGLGSQFLISKSLTDSTYDGTCITECQVSANTSDEIYISWFVSNDGGINWENTTLDTVHTFATVLIPITYTEGSPLFTYGEWVHGAITNKHGLIEGINSGSLLLSNETGEASWVVGGTLIGDDSGATATMGTPVYRNFNTDLRVKALFLNTASIYDYGILYDIDTTIDTEMYSDKLNIETLYADIYETPSLNNDGNRIYPFDSTSFTILNVIKTNDNISKAIVRLDNSKGIGTLLDGDSTSSISTQFSTYTVSSTSGFNITDFLNAYNGQKITIVNIGAVNVTIDNSSKIHLSGSTNFVMGEYDSLSLVYISPVVGWVEISRSVN
jgi:hypothetical protein